MKRTLRVKPTFESLISYIERDPDKIKLPNRNAKLLRNSIWMTQLDNEGSRQLEVQQFNQAKEAEKDPDAP